jgi:hypothetical protein
LPGDWFLVGATGVAAVGEPHLHGLAAIEIDGRIERFLRFVGTDQNRGDEECEVHGVGKRGRE